MSGISSLYILDQKGKVIITRAYRPDVPFNIHEKFNAKLFEYDETTLKPIIIDNQIVFCFTKHNDLTFLAVSCRNSNAMMIFAFLYKFQEALYDFFQQLDEETIRDNFPAVYELLDEMMDNGYPQVTESRVLRNFLKSACERKPGHSGIFHFKSRTDIGLQSQPKIYGNKNEMFIDVKEKINMLIGANGNIINSEILGTVKVKTLLNGMPRIILGFNDIALMGTHGGSSKAIELESVKFHQCVDVGVFEEEKKISFISPDTEFDLMSYRIDRTLKPPFAVECYVKENSQTRINFQVQVKSNFRSKFSAKDVTICIPVPNDVQTPSLKSSIGSASYDPAQNSMVWVIKQFAGQKEYNLDAVFSLPTVASPDRSNFNKIPISLKFEIPYFSASGLEVKSFKIREPSGYKFLPWVRYVTENGDYFIRMSS